LPASPALSHRFDPPMVFNRPSTKAMIVAVFTALALSTDYALIGLQNIKLMDTLVFIAGFLFGIRLGVAVAVPTWLVYGLVNPNGVDDPITLSFLILGECLYALGGGILRRTSIGEEIYKMESPHQGPIITDEGNIVGRMANRVRQLDLTPSLVFALVGLQATFGYDLLTNFISWSFRTTSLYQAFIIGNIVGVPFSVAHEGSNLVFFATVAPAVIVAVRRMGFGFRSRSSVK
jgi:hypothetical protein